MRSQVISIRALPDFERNLAQVERDLRAASEDIAHQRETLRNLVRRGEDTTEAVRSNAAGIAYAMERDWRGRSAPVE